MRVSAGGMDIMDKKALFRVVRVNGLDIRAANILKQEMLSRGGEVARLAKVYELDGERSRLPASWALSPSSSGCCPSSRRSPSGCARWPTRSRRRSATTTTPRPGVPSRAGPLRAGLCIMGILNVTPDSFSDGGVRFDRDAAVAGGAGDGRRGGRARRRGGRVHPAGFRAACPGGGAERVMPVVRALARLCPAASPWTPTRRAWRPRPWRRGRSWSTTSPLCGWTRRWWPWCVTRGARWSSCTCWASPKTMQADPVYDDVVREVYAFFVERLNWAVDNGLKEENLLIDPGIGFGKTTGAQPGAPAQPGGLPVSGPAVVVGRVAQAVPGRDPGTGRAARPGRRHGGDHGHGGARRSAIVRVHEVACNRDAARVWRGRSSAAVGLAGCSDEWGLRWTSSSRGSRSTATTGSAPRRRCWASGCSSTCG